MCTSLQVFNPCMYTSLHVYNPCMCVQSLHVYIPACVQSLHVYNPCMCVQSLPVAVPYTTAVSDQHCLKYLLLHHPNRLHHLFACLTTCTSQHCLTSAQATQPHPTISKFCLVFVILPEWLQASQKQCMHVSGTACMSAAQHACQQHSMHVSSTACMPVDQQQATQFGLLPHSGRMLGIEGMKPCSLFTGLLHVLMFPTCYAYMRPARC